ncbi:MAG: M1 family metallopeptidase, partial [Bacteroidales bacterium]|nr:M1 family metallopeptidase [Bacteroidales bacterium]
LINISEVEDGKHTYEWFLKDEIPTYLASVAVGEYALYESIYNGVERDIPIQVYVYPSHINRVEGTLINFDSIVSIFETKFGPYPWERIGFVAVPFSSGAMEHATNIAMPSLIFTGDTSYEDLFAHEFAHHWFGDAITCSTAQDMWINEGWATYCESIYREFLYGRENMIKYRRASHAKVVRYAHIEDDGFLELDNIPLDKTYCSTVYQKGAGLAHSLRTYLGDNMFFDAITALVNHYKFKNLSTNDMKEFLSDYTGIELQDWFDGWVSSPGFPHYAIDSVKITEEGENYEAKVYVKQKMRGRTNFVNSNKIPISFLNSQYQDTTVFVHFDGEFGEASFELNEMPKFVFCDYHETMCDAKVSQSLWIKNTTINSPLNLYTRLKASNITADSLFVRVTHNWVAPDSMKQKIDGLFLADNRYWLIEGDFNENCDMKCEFQYGVLENASTNGYLDNEFINNSLDSVVLMYRPNKAADWQIIEHTNQTSTKRLVTENLLPGEYALGIWNWSTWVNNKVHETKNFNIFPNPSNNKANIQFDKAMSGKIRVFNAAGSLISEF